jgi:VWFA-related protein
MYCKFFAGVCAAVFIVTVLAIAQDAPPGSASDSTIKVATHLVTLSVVATDKHGPVADLTADDFEIYEKRGGDLGDNILTSWAVRQHEQKIAFFQNVRFHPDLNPSTVKVTLPEGMYSNISFEPITSPPTFLVLDVLNTEMADQQQVKRNMLLALERIPPHTPMAVYILGRTLRMVQDMTVDSDLLKEAIKLAVSAETMVERDPHYDPTSAANQLKDAIPALTGSNNPNPSVGQAQSGGKGQAASLLQMEVMLLRAFEKEMYGAAMDVRVDLTLKAFQTIAAHARGYRGRKRLIWVSGSFPIFLKPDRDDQGTTFEFRGMKQYQPQIQRASNAINNAEIAIYPINAKGLETDTPYDASNGNGKAFAGQLEDAGDDRFARHGTMNEVAGLTGGLPCLYSNGLDRCVIDAIQDGLQYYEMAYYPNEGKWDGEYRRIYLKCKRKGVKLRYRTGYYAGETKKSVVTQVKYKSKDHKTEIFDGPIVEAMFSPFTSTGIVFTIQTQKPDDPRELKYEMHIDPATLTFLPKQHDQQTRELALEFAWGAFDRDGGLMGYLQYSRTQGLKDVDYRNAMARGVGHTISLPSYGGAKRIRLLVRDPQSGNVGTIDVQSGE